MKLDQKSYKQQGLKCIPLLPWFQYCTTTSYIIYWHYLNNVFKYKNGATRYTHVKVDRNKSYLTSDPLHCDNKYTANDICKMIEVFVDNIYVKFDGQLFQKMVAKKKQNCGNKLCPIID